MAIGYYLAGQQLKIIRTSDFIHQLIEHAITNKKVWTVSGIEPETTKLKVAGFDTRAGQQTSNNGLAGTKC